MTRCLPLGAPFHGFSEPFYSSVLSCSILRRSNNKNRPPVRLGTPGSAALYHFTVSALFARLLAVVVIMAELPLCPTRSARRLFGTILRFRPCFARFAAVITRCKNPLSQGISLLGSFSVPFCGFGQVFLNSPACGIMSTELPLCSGVSLFCGLSPPFHGLGPVGINPFTVATISALAPLRLGVPLLGGFSEPVYGFGLVLLNTQAEVITINKSPLSLGVPLLGGFSERIYAFGYVLLNAFAKVTITEPPLSLGVPCPADFRNQCAASVSLRSTPRRCNSNHRAAIVPRRLLLGGFSEQFAALVSLDSTPSSSK